MPKIKRKECQDLADEPPQVLILYQRGVTFVMALCVFCFVFFNVLKLRPPAELLCASMCGKPLIFYSCQSKEI